MIKNFVRACLVATLGAATVPVLTQELGTITFPTSGAPAAQAALIEGVKDLHSFQFDEAAVASSARRQRIRRSQWPTGARR